MQTLSMAHRHATALIVALSVALPGIAGAIMLKTDSSKSNITAVFKQMNVPLDARFKKFSAQVDFNSNAPEKSKANIEIDIASFDLGDAEYNKEVQKKDWFNTAQFPKATFISSSIKAGAAGKLDVSGKLTIKGKSTDVSFPLTIKKDGTNNVFEGSLPIKRLAYNIGEGEWKDTSMVGDEVVIKFHIVTAQ
jgi:polyisoprenoid-binding protein YceI